MNYFHPLDQIDFKRPLFILSMFDSLLSASSHPIGAQQFGVDYDLILRNVKELNILAGEGQHVIQHTLSGAKLKVIPESSPTTTGGIKLYAVLTRVCSLSGG